ncbi:MAG: hydroxymethylglutaryl-CoA reductase [Sandaracinaceae bacterium]
MQAVPRALLNTLYNRASLRNGGGHVRFSLKNRLAPASLETIDRLVLDGEVVPADRIQLAVDDGEPFPISRIGSGEPLLFPLGALLTFQVDAGPLSPGEHTLELTFQTDPFGALTVDVTDALDAHRNPSAIPRDEADDYTPEVIRSRQEFLERRLGVQLEHIRTYGIDPRATEGNIEHFIGTAQLPLGIAGPLLVKGDHAEGEFYVPLATTEGTLVASYNRGMKVIHRSGGVKCTVVGDNMQRAPVFIFQDASRARRFVDWIVEKSEDIKAVCHDSDPFVNLKHVDYYLSNSFAFLRFNFTTGDAAGMNMVSKATFAACNWIIQNCDAVEIERFFLESNFATDKKHSTINTMRTRGKRVTAEMVINRQALRDIMGADTESLYRHARVANVGSMLSGTNNNGLHSANAITAMFIATGQDAANVAESSSAVLFTELTPSKDLYLSVTLPSLIVATIGGGTGLPTQRESLELMGCYGKGKVRKLAEIVAGTVFAGEISLAAAISSLDWVSAHDRYGRNDPTKKSS